MTSLTSDFEALSSIPKYVPYQARGGYEDLLFGREFTKTLERRSQPNSKVAGKR